ncbi:septum formation family protein [Arthrobacter silvisoli]|uniref:septum formation family protein n=1 Tax=Arthrobacter silvisoli TaxID=2291022 RepID=UPI001FEAEABA|nr:septum formation family protein [Arthrobacter silvisoli]
MGQENPFPDNTEDGYGDAVPANRPAWSRRPMDLLTRQRLIIGGVVLFVLLLIIALIWTLVSVFGNRPEPAGGPGAAASASRPPLPADIESKDYRVGDCFADFDSNADKARAVECTTPHSAQLGAVFSYKENDSFPGTNALRDKGRAVCLTVMLNEASRNYKLLQQNVYPSSTSWDSGDRRVDCFIVVDSGNTLKESVLQK